MGRVAGTVVEIRGLRARVACAAGAAGCGACADGHGCGWRRRVATSPLEIPATVDGRPLVVGESVELEADDGQLLAAVARLYLPPLAGLLLVPALARACGLDNGVAPLLAAAVGLILGGLVARVWARWAPNVVVRRP